VDKNIDPNISGQPYDQWVKHYVGGKYGEKRLHQRAVEKYIADDKRSDREGDSHAITHIHGSIKKGRLDTVYQTTVTALVMHFKQTT
jgi:hypothetical protein